MFDLWVRDTEITVWFAVSAVLIILPIQLILCFKAKRLLVKLLPVALLAVTTIIFSALMLTARDWTAFGYAILAVFYGVLLLFGAIAWGIWAIAKQVKRKKATKGC